MAHNITPVTSPIPGAVPPEYVSVGRPIPAIEQITLFSADEWEDFVTEWASTLTDTYSRVEPHGGAGDMGRDVIAFIDDGDIWDNFQCKHYDHPLHPSDVLLEIGKLTYHTHMGHYSIPRKYYFVAPRGVGTSMANLLRKPSDLRALLIEKWNKYCLNTITCSQQVTLSPDLKSHIENIDFSIFTYLSPATIIFQHSQTRFYAARFGGGLPQRSECLMPPESPADVEIKYVRKLLDAYSDHLGVKVQDHGSIPNPKLREHLSDSRVEFYSAESLRLFSRDNLPEGEFERLQIEIHDGVRDEIRVDHPDGYQRVLQVVKTAKMLPVTSHSLNSRIHARDKGGICHQLANENDSVVWVEEDD